MAQLSLGLRPPTELRESRILARGNTGVTYNCRIAGESRQRAHLCNTNFCRCAGETIGDLALRRGIDPTSRSNFHDKLCRAETRIRR